MTTERGGGGSDKDEMPCILLYVNQSQMPNWYSNNLLSNAGRTLLGNVLLVLPDQDWPKQLVVTPEHVGVLMQLDEDGAKAPPHGETKRG